MTMTVPRDTPLEAASAPTAAVPRHVAFIMDGNGRWARERGLPRLAGHRAGVENIRAILRECVDLGIEYVTMYAFSTENWTRPRAEVDGLMLLMGEFIDREARSLHAEGVKVRHLGTSLSRQVILCREQPGRLRPTLGT